VKVLNSIAIDLGMKEISDFRRRHGGNNTNAIFYFLEQEAIFFNLSCF